LFCQQLNGCPDSAEEAQRWDRGLVFLLFASSLPIQIQIQILPSASMADSPALAAPLFVVVLLVTDAANWRRLHFKCI